MYTGDDPHDEKELSLADAFWEGDRSAVEVRVKVIYGDEPDAILSEYAAFTRTFKKYKALYGKTVKAVEETVDECIRNNILREYLTERREEVMDIMTALFDDDVIQEMYEKSIRRESREEGREEEILQLYIDGDIVEDVALRRLNCSKKRLEELVRERCM